MRMTDPPWRKLRPEGDDRQDTSGAFRDLILAALFSGARYGALCKLRAEDLFISDDGRGKLLVPQEASKSKKPYTVHLTPEDTKFFRSLVAGKRPRELLLARDDGRPWERSSQREPMEQAIKAARLEAETGKDRITFHTLRHYISFRTMSCTSVFA
jgi:integrase